MRRDIRLTILLLAPAVLLAGWEAVALALLVAGADPAARPPLLAALTGQAPVLVVWWLAAAAAAGFGLHRLYDLFIAGTARLADATRVLAGDPAAPALPAPETAALQPLAAAINALADKNRVLRLDMEERIGAASAAVAYQRDQLAALIAELEQGVIVCNGAGRILFYNRRSSALFSPAGATVGLGRPIESVLDSALVAHAREGLEAGTTSPERMQFVTGLADGRLLRVNMAAVRPATEIGSDMTALTGFILLLDDITTDHLTHASRDARLLALTEASRASLAAMQAAIDVLAYPDLADEERQRFQMIVRDEVAAMSTRVEALAEDTSADLKSRWPLQDMLGADLIAAAARRIAAITGIVAGRDAAPGLWLRVDSFAIISALVFLVSRYGAHAPVLRVRHANSRAGTTLAHLDLLWRDDSADPATGWQTEPVVIGDERLPLSVRDVAERHDGEVWFGREGAERFVRFLLPQAQGAPKTAPLLPGSRPVYYDFDLFRTAAVNRALDDRLLGEINYTVFDTETTGLDPAGGDEIIQIGATRIVNGRLLDGECFDQFVDPGRFIPEASIPIHGITPEMVHGQPRIGAVLPAFRAFVGDTVLVGHNVAFDMRFLQLKEAKTGIRFDQPVLDTLLLASLIHPHESAHGLEAVAARLGVSVAARHSARGDALTTAAVFLKLMPLLAQKGIATLGEARKASAGSVYARLKY